MSDYQSLRDKITAYLGLGVFITVLVLGIILLFYVVFWGALIGLIIFAIAYIKSKFFPPKVQDPTIITDPKKFTGRIIEHEKDDDKEQ